MFCMNDTDNFDRPTKLLNKTWKKMGLYAGVSFTLLAILSIKPIRQRYYEAFYVGHIALVLWVFHCYAKMLAVLTRSQLLPRHIASALRATGVRRSSLVM